MEVPVELARIVITELGEEQVIFLREKGGQRTFPIVIGIAEAIAIDRRLHERPTPRPMTHDLLGNVIEAMGGNIEKIVIDDIRDHAFIATLHIRLNGNIIKIDSRPSDAIAVGVGYNTPIFVADHVMKDVMAEPTLQSRIEMLQSRLAVLAERIAEMTDQLQDEEYTSKSSPAELQEHRRVLKELKQEYEAIDRVLKKIK